VSPRPHCVVAVLFGLASVPALAAEPSIYTWQASPTEVQLLEDTTVLPAGMGALFVPALTTSTDEPSVFIVSPDAVKLARTGERVILPPGRYVVVAGSSDPRRGAGATVEVREGRTAVAPVLWGAMKVEVVDRGLRRHDGPYTLVEVSSGDSIELPEVLDTEEGVRTLLLKPGLYRLMQPGAKTLTGPDFATVHVPEGGLVHFRLFMDRGSGQFRGGGVIPAELSTPEARPPDSDWTGSLVVGVDGTFSQTQHVPGMLDMAQIAGNGFLDGRARYQGDMHALSLTAELALGQQYLGFTEGRDLPIIKSQDRAALGARYTFLFNEGVGLYVRGTGETQLFDTNAIATEDLTVALRKRDGSVEYVDVDGGDSYRISEALSPLMLQTSTGLETRFASTRWLDVSVYGGPGYRWNRYNGAYVNEDNPDTRAVEYTRVGDFEQFGIDVGLSGFMRLSGWMTNTTSIGTFWEFDAFDAPVLELDNTLNLRITELLSINYVVNLYRVPRVTEELQVRQGAFLRAKWSLL